MTEQGSAPLTTLRERLLLPILNNNPFADFGNDLFLTLFPLELADQGLGDRDIITPALASHGQFSDMFFCHGIIITNKYVLCTYFFPLKLKVERNIPFCLVTCILTRNYNQTHIQKGARL